MRLGGAAHVHMHVAEQPLLAPHHTLHNVSVRAAARRACSAPPYVPATARRRAVSPTSMPTSTSTADSPYPAQRCSATSSGALPVVESHPALPIIESHHRCSTPSPCRVPSQCPPPSQRPAPRSKPMADEYSPPKCSLSLLIPQPLKHIIEDACEADGAQGAALHAFVGKGRGGDLRVRELIDYIGRKEGGEVGQGGGEGEGEGGREGEEGLTGAGERLSTFSVFGKSKQDTRKLRPVLRVKARSGAARSPLPIAFVSAPWLSRCQPPLCVFARLPPRSTRFRAPCGRRPKRQKKKKKNGKETHRTRPTHQQCHHAVHDACFDVEGRRGEGKSSVIEGGGDQQQRQESRRQENQVFEYAVPEAPTRAVCAATTRQDAQQDEAVHSQTHDQ
ncbi:hypothetical protein C8R45DRAFT_939051 [Mycena sanguinolenta]|nr:hypothetical protein C8R45DRAFT_939051 [Mycena sanguinolenta]